MRKARREKMSESKGDRRGGKVVVVEAMEFAIVWRVPRRRCWKWVFGLDSQCEGVDIGGLRAREEGG